MGAVQLWADRIWLASILVHEWKHLLQGPYHLNEEEAYTLQDHFLTDAGRMLKVTILIADPRPKNLSAYAAPGSELPFARCIEDFRLLTLGAIALEREGKFY